MASASIEKDPRFKHILTDPRFNVCDRSQMFLPKLLCFLSPLEGTQTC